MPDKKNNTCYVYLITLLQIVVVTSIPLAVVASESKLEPSDSYFLDEIPTVLSANRLATPQLEAPASTTIIDKMMIEASGAKEIVELFRLVPGMQVGYYTGHYPTTTYHGMADVFSRRMQVLVDGSSIYLPSSGGISWRDLPWQIEDIERIEVVRGPAAASYGPNSFLGVINIITTHTAHDQGTTIKSSIGNQGYHRLLLRQGGSSGKLNYRINLSYIEDSGFSELNDSQHTNSLNSRLDYKLTEQDSLRLNLGYSKGPREYESYASTQSREAFYASLKWERTLSASESFYLNTMYSYNAGQQSSYFNSGNDQRTERVDLEFQHTLQPSPDTRLIWGAGLRKDKAMAEFWLNSDRTEPSHSQRFFVNSEWHITDKIILNSGALLERNDFSDGDFSPRLALNYLFLPNHSFRFIASNASRSPTTAEEHLDLPTGGIFPAAQSSGDLSAEKSHYFEVGYHGKTFHNKLSTDIKLYRQKFHQLITSKTPYTPRIVDNRDSAESHGVEAEFNYRPSTKTLFHAGISQTKVTSSSDDPDYSNSAPSTDFNFLASTVLRDDWHISGAIYFRKSMSWLRSSNYLSNHSRLDLSLAKSVKLGAQEKISFSLTLQNALDKNEELLLDSTYDNRLFFEMGYHVR
jgi:iron complex outermembrane receptor protein